jgi:hypothetical protein
MDTHQTGDSVERLAAQLEAWGLQGVFGVLLDVARPLAPIGAGLLWIAQPAAQMLLGLTGRQGIARWAQILEDPEAFAQYRARLVDEAPHDDD